MKTRIKKVQTGNKVNFYPQMYAEPTKFFGFVIQKGFWCNFVVMFHAINFHTLEEAQEYIDKYKLGNGVCKIEYIDY